MATIAREFSVALAPPAETPIPTSPFGVLLELALCGAGTAGVGVAVGVAV